MPLETIIVGIEPDNDHDSLIDATLDVAVPMGSSIVLGVAHSEETFTAAGEDFAGRVSPDELAARSKEVKKSVSRLEDASVSYDVRGGVGDAGETFISLAEDLDSDLLFVQGRTRSPAGKALFGSTAQTVLLNAPCPVTFVRR